VEIGESQELNDYLFVFHPMLIKAASAFYYYYYYYYYYQERISTSTAMQSERASEFFVKSSAFLSTSEYHIAHWLSEKQSERSFRFDSYATGVALDEIPRELPGCLNTKRLLGVTQLRCTEEAIKDLLHDDRVASFWEPRECGSPILTAEEHTEHLNTLAEAGVISVKRTGLLHWARYFPVLKTNRLARAIFDCRDFNRCCKDAPYLNLLRMDVLLSMLAAESWTELFMHQFDLRHNFYQLKIGEELSRHFGIQCGNFVAHCVCAPMGWKRSPYCCISVNYGICLAGLSTKLHVKVPDISNASPPAFLEILDSAGERVGFIFVWYDNICVISKNRSIGQQWVAHIRTQLRRFNAAVKQDEESSIFLGLNFFTVGGHMHWSHADLSKYNDAWVGYESTRKEIAQAAGIILWDKTVSGRPWWDLKKVLQVSQNIGRNVHKRRDWNEVFPLPYDQESAINAALARIQSGLVYSRTFKPRQVVRMASDASKHFTAFVVLAESGLCKDCVSFPQDALPGKIIFLLELHGAKRAIVFASKHHKGKRLYLAVDNKGVYHALRKGFSLVPEAEADFDDIQHAIESGDLEVIPVFVPGICNVADSPTRHHMLSKRRLRDTLAYIQAVEKGFVAWKLDDESDTHGDSDEDASDEDEEC